MTQLLAKRSVVVQSVVDAKDAKKVKAAALAHSLGKRLPTCARGLLKCIPEDDEDDCKEVAANT